jgi:site-specific recombinase XerC
MVAAMLLAGLPRCRVLGLRTEDLRVAERRVFIADGKGGHQRLVPVSALFFTAVAVGRIDEFGTCGPSNTAAYSPTPSRASGGDA